MRLKKIEPIKAAASEFSIGGEVSLSSEWVWIFQVRSSAIEFI